MTRPFWNIGERRCPLRQNPCVKLEGTSFGHTGTGASVLWRYGDGVWTAVDSPTRQPLLSVASVSPREVWAVGMGGVIVHCGSSACGLVNGSA
ncbi:MAG TPA: hypothetical protein VF725_13320 [Ktedonobacterales bacterium]